MRYFIAVGETLHFGRAAERLNLSQPPLSRQIAALENELGVKLFERQSRRPRLTPVGAKFLEDAKVTVAQFDEACRNTKLFMLGERGNLTLGFMMHASHTIVPELVGRFAANYKDVELRLQETVQFELLESLLAGRVDLGILLTFDRVPGLEVRVLSRENLCLAVYPGHKLEGVGIVSVEDLLEEDMIAVPLEAAPTLREATAKYFRDANIVFKVRLETRTQQAIVGLVGQRLGIAIVPSSVGKPGDGLIYKELHKAPTIDCVIAWRTNNTNPAIRSFLEVTIAGGAS